MLILNILENNYLQMIMNSAALQVLMGSTIVTLSTQLVLVNLGVDPISLHFFLTSLFFPFSLLGKCILQIQASVFLLDVCTLKAISLPVACGETLH